MAFVLPSEYKSKSDAPQPTDPRVELVDVPERLVAVKVFSGAVDYNSSQQIAAKFKTELEEYGLKQKSDSWQLGTTRLTLWFLRTNEIWVDIEHDSDYGKAPTR